MTVQAVVQYRQHSSSTHPLVSRGRTVPGKVRSRADSAPLGGGRKPLCLSPTRQLVRQRGRPPLTSSVHRASAMPSVILSIFMYMSVLLCASAILSSCIVLFKKRDNSLLITHTHTLIQKRVSVETHQRTYSKVP